MTRFQKPAVYIYIYIHIYTYIYIYIIHIGVAHVYVTITGYVGSKRGFRLAGGKWGGARGWRRAEGRKEEEREKGWDGVGVEMADGALIVLLIYYLIYY